MSVFSTNKEDPKNFQWHKNNRQDELECGKLLDWMWQCYRPIGFLRSVYRDGQQPQPCEVSFSDFQYCLKLKTASKAEAEASLNERFPPSHIKWAGGKHVWELHPEVQVDEADDASSASSSYFAPLTSLFPGRSSSSAAASTSVPPTASAPATAPASSSSSLTSSSSSSALASPSALVASSAASPSAAWQYLSSCKSCEANLTPL